MIKCDCGGEAKAKIQFDESKIEDVEYANFFYVSCQKCGKRTKHFGHKEEAEKAWNNRDYA